MPSEVVPEAPTISAVTAAEDAAPAPVFEEEQLVIDLRSYPACLGQMKLRRMKVFLLLKEVSAAYKNSVLDSGDQFLCSTL